MFKNKFFTWVSQNLVKTILAAATLTGAGYLTYDDEARNDVRKGLSGVLDPYTKYHLRVDFCAFRQDTLSIKLAVCNDGSYTLPGVELKIDSASVKLCNADTVKFSVARQRNKLRQLTPMDSVFYGDVARLQCALSPDKMLKHFKFCAPPMRNMNAKNDSLCVHLMVKVYHSNFTTPDTSSMHLRVPLDKISVPGTPVLSAVETRVPVF